MRGRTVSTSRRDLRIAGTPGWTGWGTKTQRGPEYWLPSGGPRQACGRQAPTGARHRASV